MSPVMAVTAPSRAPRPSILRLLERDERLFAVLLAVVMVGGLATLGLVPLRPRHRVDVYALIIWFALYKAGILRWSRSTRRLPVASSPVRSASTCCSSSRCCT